MKTLCLLLAILICIGCTACIFTQNSAGVSGYAMDTVYSVNCYGPRALDCAEACEDMIKELAQGLDWYNEQSYIYALNHAKGSWVSVDEATLDLLALCTELYEQTGGAFHPALGGLIELWDGFSGEAVPQREEALALANSCDFSLELDPTEGKAKLSGNGVLALGAIAKGFIADRLSELILSCGCSGVVDLGGNIMTVGEKGGGKPWTVGIRDPQNPERLAKTLELYGSWAVVTSGSYERGFTADGIYYHHIIDPKTGFCSDSGLISVSIISPSGAVADALATAAFVLGAEKGAELAVSMGVSAFFIYENGESFEVGP